MSETNNEILIEVVEKVKKPRGRPRKIEGEYAPSKPKDNEYFKNYYHTSNLSEVISCELCSRTITRQKLKHHQKSSRCKPIYKIVLEELPEII